MIYLLIVLYKKTIVDSDSIKSLLELDETLRNSFKLILWDNSPNAMLKEDISFLEGNFTDFRYTHTSGNLTLSEIYNTVIEKYIASEDYLILFDHDSVIPPKFFNELYSEIRNHPEINLFLPCIVVGEDLVSPANDYIIKSSKWKVAKTGLMKSDHMTGINSGMTISGRFLKNFRYNQRLFYYGTDNYMMKNYRRSNALLFVLKTNINHDLSFLSDENIDAKVNIFSETKRSNLIIHSDNIIHYALAKLNNTIVSTKLAIIHRDFRFFK